MEDRVLNSATKLLASVLGLAIIGSPLYARAGVQTALPLLLSAASLGADTRNPVAEADQLLHDARQAMSEGNLEIADSKITAAEKLAPKYFPLHVGDTPKRARADLDKLLTQRAVGSDKNAKQALAKSASAAGSTADPFQSRNSPTTAGGASTDGSLANGLNSTPNSTAALSGAQGPAATDPATLAQGALPASFGMNPSGSGTGNNPQGNSSAFGSSRLRNPSAGSGLANSATGSRRLAVARRSRPRCDRSGRTESVGDRCLPIRIRKSRRSIARRQSERRSAGPQPGIGQSAIGSATVGSPSGAGEG